MELMHEQASPETDREIPVSWRPKSLSDLCAVLDQQMHASCLHPGGGGGHCNDRALRPF